MSPSANASERCSLSSSSWRHHGTRLLIAFGLLIGTMTVSQLAAGASVAAGGCSDPTPYRWHPTGPAAGSGLSASQLNAVAGLKASELANDPALRAELARAEALSAPNIALKEKRRAATLARADAGTGGLTMDQACGALGAKRGSLLQRFQNTLGTVAAASGSISYGNNWAWLNNLNQQNQTKSYYCGPAAVSEASYSMNAPAASQGTVATPMHTDQNGQTYAGDELNGTNQFVGRPVFGFNFYVWVSLPDPPSSQQRTDFWNRVITDVRYDWSALVGDAWEMPGGPHLEGHPDIEIRHYIQLGGYSSDQGPLLVYYSDSANSMHTTFATRVWTQTVPAYQWIDNTKLTTILGGLGYIW